MQNWPSYLPKLVMVLSVLLLGAVGLLLAFSKSKEPQPEFGNIQGFGFLPYGWRHAADGTATATKWLVALWLPLIPLRRERVRVLTDFRTELAQPAVVQPIPMGRMAVQYDRKAAAIRQGGRAHPGKELSAAAAHLAGAAGVHLAGGARVAASARLAALLKPQLANSLVSRTTGG